MSSANRRRKLRFTRLSLRNQELNSILSQARLDEEKFILAIEVPSGIPLLWLDPTSGVE